MNVLLIGAGLVGTVYGVSLAKANNKVSVLAYPGDRIEEIKKSGLVSRDISTGKTYHEFPTVVTKASPGQYDLVLICVRMEQLTSTFPALDTLSGSPTVLFFGNNPNGRSSLPSYLPLDLELGFPGVGGYFLDGIAHYVRIPQQPSTLQKNCRHATRDFAVSLTALGFKFNFVENIDGWLLYHTVFISCVGSALSKCNYNAIELSTNRSIIKLMCGAITEGFAALRHKGVEGAPVNLELLHRGVLKLFAIIYWQRIFRTPMGEICFAAHVRIARDELRDMSAFVIRTLLNKNKSLVILTKLLNSPPQRPSSS